MNQDVKRDLLAFLVAASGIEGAEIGLALFRETGLDLKAQALLVVLILGFFLVKYGFRFRLDRD